ncbi:hypothetical protein ACSHWG_03845 [Leucobacter sp. Z1108]|uniref:hypothetical protein n=1 Tax=Leucobacter sp. Z1108 TaxID=3439066 RepID=UPI003F3AD28F
MRPESTARRVLAQGGALVPAVILLDGRSGSGKTVLAESLCALSQGTILHLDDLYPGWDGLSAGSRAVATALQTGTYSRFDWVSMQSAEQMSLCRHGPLIVEGCGAVTARNLHAARAWAAGLPVHSIWLECPTDVRQARALSRDGDMFRPHWEAWASQEEAHLAVERPLALAAEVIHCR